MAGASPKKPRKKSVSATMRTLRQLKRDGWTCAVLEKWIDARKIRIDAWGVVDIGAIRDGCIKLVQSTTQAHVGEHLRKILAHPNGLKVAQTRVYELWGWRALKGNKAKGKPKWEASILLIEPGMFDGAEPPLGAETVPEVAPF